MKTFNDTLTRGKSVDNQKAVIGYIKLSRIRSYLLHARHISPEHYCKCLSEMDKPLGELLSLMAEGVSGAALDFILFGVDWEKD
jgi:hypothetical protein